ncbi:MAG: thioredoxin [Chloroflexota bacterium]
MPVFNTPITTNEDNLKKVLAQGLPALLVLHRDLDKPLQDALEKSAKKHAGNLLVVRVDVEENPGILVKYGEPAPPALVTITADNHVKSDAIMIRPKDVRNHIAHLLDDKPLPAGKAKREGYFEPLTVTDQNFRKEVLKSKMPVLVDFWATWCQPCHMIAPHIKEIARDHGDKIKVAKLDVDRNQVMAGRYNVRSIPTMILFEGGQPAQRITGADPSSLRAMIKHYI